MLLEEIYDFLQPFAVATRHMEGCRYPTLSTVIPLYNKLLDLVEDWAADENKSMITRKAADNAREKMTEYYDKLTEIYTVATALDPRLKLAYFQDNGWGAQNDPDIGGAEDEAHGAAAEVGTSGGAGGRTLMDTRIKPA